MLGFSPTIMFGVLSMSVDDEGAVSAGTCVHDRRPFPLEPDLSLERGPDFNGVSITVIRAEVCQSGEGLVVSFQDRPTREESRVQLTKGR